MQFFSALALLGACAVAQAATFVGCSSTAVSSYNYTSPFMSYGACENACKQEACGAPTAMAISGTLCHCGKLPDQNDLVDEALCDTPCPGFDQDKCGGENTFSIFSL
ncbi:transmembrane alpha-helix domain-containing protein [Apiospora phragmitis]|uniref:Transmembrane alpha-helix domain-containing protein n=1 Tax=Apiospora phragmitis TaxID=2905665 RepID=A0ABR1VZZ3_9PEZI